MKAVLLVCIRGYQATISPMYGAACRHEPSCSRYMYQAIELHGSLRGVWLGLRRLVRCRPGGSSGYDPVPPPKNQISKSELSETLAPILTGTSNNDTDHSTNDVSIHATHNSRPIGASEQRS